MRRVRVIFGGRSGEHEVSVTSAESVVNALDRSKYQVKTTAIRTLVTAEAVLLATSFGSISMEMAVRTQENRDSRTSQ